MRGGAGHGIHNVILTALFKWSFGVIFREFKTVTGSIVTFGVEVELGVNLRQICERYYTVISIKITAVVVVSRALDVSGGRPRGARLPPGAVVW